MSNLTRWDPFQEMMAWRSAMDRMFDRAITAPDAWTETDSWNLALDVAETDNEFLVKASLPGIKPEDLEITYNANVLTIKGETKEEKDVNDKHYHLRERRYGSFSRSISLPATVKSEAIEASYDAGVLTLHLPKAEEAKPKRIQIKNGGIPKMIEGKIKDNSSKK
jgi:HSP20 family protein